MLLQTPFGHPIDNISIRVTYVKLIRNTHTTAAKPRIILEDIFEGVIDGTPLPPLSALPNRVRVRRQLLFNARQRENLCDVQIDMGTRIDPSSQRERFSLA
jgi:hypothetical protein